MKRALNPEDPEILEPLEAFENLDLVSSSFSFLSPPKNLVSSLLERDLLLRLVLLDMTSSPLTDPPPRLLSVSFYYLICFCSAITDSVSSLNLSLLGNEIVFLPASLSILFVSLSEAILWLRWWVL